MGSKVSNAADLVAKRDPSPRRVAATGGGNSPSLDITLALLDKDKVLARIDQALVVVEERIAAG